MSIPIIANSPSLVNTLNKICLALAVVAVLASGAWAAQEAFVINRPGSGAELRLLPAEAWGPPEADGGNMLLKLSYIRGMIDALSYAQVAPRGSGQALEQLRGQSLSDVVAAIDRYYLADPRRRDLPPAAVLLRILPQQSGQQGPDAPPAVDLPAPDDSWVEATPTPAKP